MTLPKHDRSGATPNSSWAPPRASRKPVMTSSKTSSAPTRSHAARRPGEEPGAGATRPMLAATGSTMTHGDALVELRARRCTAPRRCRPPPTAVTPAEPGRPERGHAAAALGQQRVAVAVVVAGELHDSAAAGEPAGQADGRSSSPRCRSTPAGPARTTAPGRRSPRPAAPRARSGRRRRCRRPPPAAPPRRWPGGRGRG